MLTYADTMSAVIRSSALSGTSARSWSLIALCPGFSFVRTNQVAYRDLSVNIISASAKLVALASQNKGARCKSAFAENRHRVVAVSPL
ncbi:protein of unknown function [Azospirillum lipoferum 4B]|uniref:Uncharacterized protein n=1 Tax=Azospirillum lipoferum (strain 4B) TaxID=862719 RepID=G7Z5I8_AZOL4|nr:protein of unknown function [Azospirillum lipoferum 4B]